MREATMRQSRRWCGHGGGGTFTTGTFGIRLIRFYQYTIKVFVSIKAKIERLTSNGMEYVIMWRHTLIHKSWKGEKYYSNNQYNNVLI